MPEWFPAVKDIFFIAFLMSLMVVGLIVLLIPIMPGLVIIWLATLIYGLVEGFGVLGWIMFALITVLMITGSVIDNVLMGTTAHSGGAPWWAVVIALIAGLAGNALLPIIGALVAALLALFAIEWIRRKEFKKALQAMKDMLVGFGWAIVIRFIMGLFMISFWLIWALV